MTLDEYQSPWVRPTQITTIQWTNSSKFGVHFPPGITAGTRYTNLINSRSYLGRNNKITSETNHNYKHNPSSKPSQPLLTTGYNVPYLDIRRQTVKVLIFKSFDAHTCFRYTASLNGLPYLLVLLLTTFDEQMLWQNWVIILRLSPLFLSFFFLTFQRNTSVSSPWRQLT
jgi:hypothetical protein